MARKTVFVLLSIFLLFGLVSTAAAITWGQPDGEEHPYVGLVYFEQTTGVYRCTGTLLSPTVFLTAGHCTEEAGLANFRTWVTFDSEVTFPPDVLELPDAEFGDYLDASPDYVKGTAYPHPGFDDYAEFPNTYDVGVVILDEPLFMSEYGQLPSLGLLDSLVRGQARKDRGFTAVGYGLQGYIPPYLSAERTRYQGDVSLVEVNSNFNGDRHSAKFSNNPGRGNGSGGTCFGDSGGPLFHGDGRVVGAITSWGITPCIGVDYQFRMDTPMALDFVGSFLAP